MRLGQAEAATWEIGRLDLSLLSPEIGGQGHLTLAAAFLHLAKLEGARTELDAAHGTALGVGGAFEAIYRYYEAMYFLFAGDLGRAEQEALRGLEVRTSDSRMSCFSHAHARSWLLEMIGAVRGFAHRYDEQLEYLLAAFAEAEAARPVDWFTYATLISNIGILQRDLEIGDLKGFELKIPMLPPTPSLANKRFGCFRSLAWIKANAADHLGAFRSLRQASAVAVAPQWQVMAATDRAILAHGLGYESQTAEELSTAEELAKRIDWEGTLGDGKAALLYLAQAFVPLQPRRAREILDRYHRIKVKVSPIFFGARDGRLEADESFTQALVARSEHNLSETIAEFSAVFKFWDAIGYRWRAALAAAELAVLTNDDLYRGYATAQAQKKPDSWLGKRVRSILAGSSEDGP